MLAIQSCLRARFRASAHGMVYCYKAILLHLRYPRPLRHGFYSSDSIAPRLWVTSAARRNAYVRRAAEETGSRGSRGSAAERRGRGRTWNCVMDD